MASESNIAALMEPVARALLGVPNKGMSSKTELRFGSNGSVSVDLEKCAWFDHEADAGGGVLDLIARVKGLRGPDAVEWMRANGFDPGDREPRPARANDNQDPKREIEKAYDYVDAEGALLFQVLRWVFKNPDGSFVMTKDGSKKKKTFSQRRPFPEEQGVWINGLEAGEYMRRGKGKDWFRYSADNYTKWKCTERRTFAAAPDATLYRLPELLEEVALEGRVYIVEGEKKVDALAEWGIAATCNAMGSKKWRPEFAQFFAGADVIILPDNDEAGRRHLDAVAATLKPVAKRVRELSLPGLPPKGDVVDWREAGGTPEQLARLTEENAKPWSEKAFASRFGAVAFEDIDQAGPEHQFLIDDWLTVGDKSVIGGPSRSGKSFLAIHAGMAIALAAMPGLKGPDFFGSKVMAPGLVIYQAGEGARGVKNRLRAFRQRYGIPSGARVPFVLLQSKIDLYRPDGDTPALIEEVKGIAAQYDVPLRAFFIDTLATATGGADENSGRDMSAVMANIDRIAASCPGCHVGLVHHMNAAGTKLRGHTSVYANVDQVVMVVRDEVSKVRTATLDKQKDGDDGKVIRFELGVEVIGHRRDDGKEITSCVCLEVGEKDMERKAAAAQGFRLDDREEIAFRALVRALGDYGAPAPADKPGVPRDVRVVEYRRWREAFAAAAPIDSHDERAREAAIKKAMQRAGMSLLKFGVIGRDHPYVWWTGKKVRGFGPAEPQQLSPPPGADDLPEDADVSVF